MTTGRYAELARRLQEGLGVDLPLVALRRMNEQPASVERVRDQAPSACAFWRRAEHEMFYATAEDHFNCPIGAMVMGFAMPETKQQELMTLVGQMCSISYIKPEEVPHIPKFQEPQAGTLYGPLAEFQFEPDVVIVWAMPAQAMLLQEAVGASEWSEQPQAAVFGRPACAALPASMARDKATLSLGCVGMRTYTELPSDRMMVAIPGSQLEALADQLEQMLGANAEMKSYYEGQKALY